MVEDGREASSSLRAAFFASRMLEASRAQTPIVRRTRGIQSARIGRADSERHWPIAAVKTRRDVRLRAVVERHEESIMVGTGRELPYATLPADGVVPRSNEVVMR